MADETPSPSDVLMTALRFNERINRQDLAGLTDLMTDDHTFIDNAGEVHEGKERMRKGWKDFFAAYPDYRNEFTSASVRDDAVVMVGYSTSSHERLAGPSVWTAKVRGGRVAEWRVQWLDGERPAAAESSAGGGEAKP